MASRVSRLLFVLFTLIFSANATFAETPASALIEPFTVRGVDVDVTATNVETSWYARSSGLAGELVKISNVPGIG